MPLRDHFRPPVNQQRAWNEIHAMWPAMIVQQLYQLLPEGYQSAPSVQLGTEAEIDIGVLDDDSQLHLGGNDPINNHSSGGTAVATEVATLVAPEPTLILEAEVNDQDEFEVRIYDTQLEKELVAAIELVSPRNKDRPASRRAFAAKVAALLRSGVSVSIVDLITVRRANLYREVLEFLDLRAPNLGPDSPNLYSVTLRRRKLPQPQPQPQPQKGKPKSKPKPTPPRCFVDIWYYPMTIGEPLPTLPIWLDTELHILLPLEPGYEEMCKVLHVR